MAALALTLIAAAWPVPARAGDTQNARDGEPVLTSVTQALVEVGALLLDLTGLGEREPPPEADGDDGTASAQSPMGPLIDPDGYAPRDPDPGESPNGQ